MTVTIRIYENEYNRKCYKSVTYANVKKIAYRKVSAEIIATISIDDIDPHGEYIIISKENGENLIIGKSRADVTITESKSKAGLEFKFD